MHRHKNRIYILYHFIKLQERLKSHPLNLYILVSPTIQNLDPTNIAKNTFFFLFFQLAMLFIQQNNYPCSQINCRSDINRFANLTTRGHTTKIDFNLVNQGISDLPNIISGENCWFPKHWSIL